MRYSVKYFFTNCKDYDHEKHGVANMVENINIPNCKHTLRKVLLHSVTHFSGDEHRPVLVSAITEYFDPFVNFIFIHEFLHTLKIE